MRTRERFERGRIETTGFYEIHYESGYHGTIIGVGCTSDPDLCRLIEEYLPAEDPWLRILIDMTVMYSRDHGTRDQPPDWQEDREVTAVYLETHNRHVSFPFVSLLDLPGFWVLVWSHKLDLD